MMPPKNKATTRSTKKGKAVHTQPTAVVQSDNDTDWASEEEEPSMRDALRNLTAMMATMNLRLNKMDGGGNKKEDVICCCT